MSSNRWKFVLNDRYFIHHDNKNVEIYEIFSNTESKLILEIKTEIVISSIGFNPLVNNIIIISFHNGTFKIYNLLNKDKKENILFECNKKEEIDLSIFNIFNPNLIAVLTFNNNIYILDVRYCQYLNIIKLEDKINTIRWSHFDINSLEIRYKKNKIKLLNTETKVIETTKYVEGNIIDFFFIKEKEKEKKTDMIILILIKFDKIEKIKIEDNSVINTIYIDDIEVSNDNLIKDNNILIIITINKLYFIDIALFSIIKQFESFGNYIDTFFYIKQDNEVGLKYITKSEILKERIFQIKNDRIKYKENEELINIKENFYEKYFPSMLKYMCLLNFRENEKGIKYNEKKYMNIKEISDYFNEIKEVDIFFRKKFVKKILEEKIVDNKIKKDDKDNKNDKVDKGGINVKNVQDIQDDKNNEDDEDDEDDEDADNNSISELNFEKFPHIRKYIEIFNIKEIKFLKERFGQIMKEKNNLNDKFIEDFYIEIIKLLIIDNTNEKLLRTYLLFLGLFEKVLISNLTENNIEKYNIELDYYSVCFSKNDYKELFGKDKNSEKDLLFKFIDEACALNNFDYTNPDFKRFIEEFKYTLKTFPDFNQPIEYNCKNEELKWFSIKSHIFLFFNDIEIEQKNQDLLRESRVGLKKIKEKDLFNNENIIKNKYKLQSVVYLIITPCSILYNEESQFNFFCNTLLGKKNNPEELKEKYKIINDKQLLYNNEIYDNIEDICIENLDKRNYDKEEKYNFNFLVNNYVKNQDKIKQFLINILPKKVFIEAHEILFGNRNYKLLNKRYLKQLINKRLKFAPIRPNGTLGISDKISLNTLISAKKGEITSKKPGKIDPKNLNEILNTSNYVVIEEHEIFHLLNSIPYYENNCSISMDTPRKDKFEGKAEGGNYLELLLFKRIINTINLGEALFILNEENYDLSLSEFVTRFEKLDRNDLKIKGTFSEFNNYTDITKMTNEDLNNSMIEKKLSNTSNSVLDSYIVKSLENDVAFKFNRKKK